jgi:anti-sigma28 factor (negative regulator of flagellin synthesis)
VGNTARPREGTSFSAGSTEAPTDEQKDSVRRLAAWCQKPSPADASLRSKRIAVIKSAITAGTYRISAADIADKLIDHMLMNRPPRT